MLYFLTWETKNRKGGLPPLLHNYFTLREEVLRPSPSFYKKEEVDMYISYSDLVQTGIFIVALIGLCYTIFKGKKKCAAHYCNSERLGF